MKTAFVVASCLLLATCEGSARPQATPDGTAAAGAAAPSPAVRSSVPRDSEHDHTAPDTLRDRISGVSLRLVREAREPRRLPLRPMTTDSEILHGDPGAVGEPFVIRIRETAGFIVPPHSHPVDEHITVLQGTWYYGFGEVFDSTKLEALPTGSYAFAPAGTMMFAYSPEAAVVQVHGIGPFDTHWMHDMSSLEDADADAHFRFRIGDRVTTPRGEGRIRWGGASGDLVQYEIERGDGSLFGVQEKEVRRR